MGWTSVITDVGVELLNSWAAGEATMHFDTPKCGSGTVEAIAMRSQEDVTNEVCDASLVSIRPIDGGQKIGLQVRSQSSGAFTLHQIGLFAHIGDDDDPVLLALMQESTGIAVPSQAEMSEYVYLLYCVISLGEGDLDVTIDSSAFVSEGEMLSALDEKVTKVEGKGLSTFDFTKYQNFRSNSSVQGSFRLSSTYRNISNIEDIKSLINAYLSDTEWYTGTERYLITEVTLTSDISSNSIKADAGTYLLLIGGMTSMGPSVYLIKSPKYDGGAFIGVNCTMTQSSPYLVDSLFFISLYEHTKTYSTSFVSAANITANISVYRSGKVATVEGLFKYTGSSAASNILIGSLGYLPVKECYAVGYGNGTSQYVGLKLTTSGELKTATTTSPNVAYYFTLTYILP